MTLQEFQLFMAQSARLDAAAARATAVVQEAYPDYAEALEVHRLEELAHAEILARLSRGTDSTADYVVTMTKEMLLGARWTAVMLNLIERRSVIQFRMAGRGLHLMDLRHIADDEARHVRLGTEILRAINVSRPEVNRAAMTLARIDDQMEPALRDGLDRLTYRVTRDLVEILSA